MKKAITTILCSVLVSLCTIPLHGAEQQDRPNILFILVDDMGWRDLACYGHKIHETPNIDQLAAQGMRFTNAYAACPICAPSRAAIMTGKLPSNTGFVDNYASQLSGKTLQRSKERQFLKLEEVTLAEAFRAGGYQTGFLGKWHLSRGMEPRLPADQGFDVNVAGSFWGHPLKGYFSPYEMPNLKDGPEGEYLTDRLTSEAIQVMDDFSKQDKPWLLYMSYYTVHGPLHSKAEKTKKYAEKARQAKVKLKSPAYAGMVESLDENVGRMLDWLDEKGLRKDTVIVFTSDNGGMVRATENRPLRSYKGDIYEGGIRVPCIIDWPGVTRRGSVSDTPVHGVDFYATLLAMTGLPQQPEQHEDSVNLVPLLKGDTDFERGPLVWHYPVGVPHIAHSKPGSVIRAGDWKYIRFYEDGREELYNLKDDIGEANNLVRSMPERAAELKKQLDAVLKAHNATIPTAVPAKSSRPARKRRAKKATTVVGRSPDRPTLSTEGLRPFADGRPAVGPVSGSGDPLTTAGSLRIATAQGAAQPDIRQGQGLALDLSSELFGKENDRPGPFVVHLHCGDGETTGKLLALDGVVVQGLDTDAANLAAARRRPEYRQQYGSRLTFRTFDDKHLPFINNTVNVIVSSEELAVSPQEIHRVLAPGGMAIFRSATEPAISEPLASVTMIDSGRYSGFCRLAKKWPSDIDEWTHHMHGPGNNRVSRDTRLAPPLSHLQWTAGPRFTRHHEHMSSFQAMVSAQGKVFYIIDEGKKDSVLLPPDWNLVARDAFNGIELWRKKLDHWFNHMWPFKSGPLVVTRRLVVKGDRLFAALEMGGGVSDTGALL